MLPFPSHGNRSHSGPFCLQGSRPRKEREVETPSIPLIQTTTPRTDPQKSDPTRLKRRRKKKMRAWVWGGRATATQTSCMVIYSAGRRGGGGGREGGRTLQKRRTKGKASSYGGLQELWSHLRGCRQGLTAFVITLLGPQVPSLPCRGVGVHLSLLLLFRGHVSRTLPKAGGSTVRLHLDTRHAIVVH